MINDLVCINFFINDLVCINFFITQVAESYLLTLYSISSCFFNTISSSIKSELVLIITDPNYIPPCFCNSTDVKPITPSQPPPLDLRYGMACYMSYHDGLVDMSEIVRLC